MNVRNLGFIDDIIIDHITLYMIYNNILQYKIMFFTQNLKV